MLKIRVFVKELSKMFLPEDIVYIDYSDKTVTVRGCQHSDCDTCHDEYDWEQCEIMRYTDVLDNSEPRKDIFEGDIVKQSFSQPKSAGKGLLFDITGVVTWLEGGWWIVDEKSRQAISLWNEIDENKVVGNIYEQPELLKKEKK